LKASSNDPAGDAFVGSRESLMPLIDDFVADSSMASPMFLYFAANTAFRLGRIEDSAFLFYAAQLRRAVDFQRYNISPSLTATTPSLAEAHHASRADVSAGRQRWRHPRSDDWADRIGDGRAGFAGRVAARRGSGGGRSAVDI
jgi:hypothetical protein